ncbi:terminase small subunit [Cereibacter azotoformans]|uniref:Phage terminase Nu1 subunit (DNA packaging protein) n=1 Tax=Cereibacter azotoformans TaxID=43057 RepID=A0A2T5K719_9RHOB|nr:terminase small subunit [Cereibacter azotoformans]MBO4169534.1 terminase small subunit [Cereibacter azotoformans]PTR18211.1 phage terminase Nu1 subunit (DNA packaging protein) [Cereibacter azotoformans]
MAIRPRNAADANGVRTIEVRENATVSIRDAAALFGVTAQAVRDWIERGCPHNPGRAGRGNGTTVSMPAAIAWRIADQAGNGGQAQVGDDGQVYNEGLAKAADWHYRAIRRQADARRELGQLVPVDLVADAVEEDYQRVRSRLSSVPGRVSVQAAAETDASIVRTMIARAINDALSNLSSGDEIVERAGGDPAASVHDQLELDGAIDMDEHEEDDA